MGTVRDVKPGRTPVARRFIAPSPIWRPDAAGGGERSTGIDGVLERLPAATLHIDRQDPVRAGNPNRPPRRDQ